MFEPTTSISPLPVSRDDFRTGLRERVREAIKVVLEEELEAALGRWCTESFAHSLRGNPRAGHSLPQLAARCSLCCSPTSSFISRYFR